MNSNPNEEIAERARDLARQLRGLPDACDTLQPLLDAAATEIERIPHMIEVGASIAINRNQLATLVEVLRPRCDRFERALKEIACGYEEFGTAVTIARSALSKDSPH